MKNNIEKVTAIVMASGFSRRMGEQDKLLLPIGNTTFLGKTFDMLAKSKGIYEVIAVAREKEVASICAVHADQVIQNDEAEKGISESIRLGVLATDADFYLFLSADQPWLQASHIDQLCEQRKAGHIVVPTTNGRQKGPCLFSVSYRKELLALRGDKGGRQVIQNHADAVILVAIEPENALEDIDTWEKYQLLKKKLVFAKK